MSLFCTLSDNCDNSALSRGELMNAPKGTDELLPSGEILAAVRPSIEGCSEAVL